MSQEYKITPAISKQQLNNYNPSLNPRSTAKMLSVAESNNGLKQAYNHLYNKKESTDPINQIKPFLKKRRQFKGSFRNIFPEDINIKEITFKIEEIINSSKHPYQKTGMIKDLFIEANNGKPPHNLARIMRKLLLDLSYQSTTPHIPLGDVCAHIEEAANGTSNGRPSGILEHIPAELIPLAQEILDGADVRKTALKLYILDNPSPKNAITMQILEGRDGLHSSKYLQNAEALQERIQNIHLKDRQNWVEQNFGEIASPQNLAEQDDATQREFSRKILANHLHLLPKYVEAGVAIDWDTVLNRALGDPNNEKNQFDWRFYNPATFTPDVVKIIFEHRNPKEAFIKLANAKKIHTIDPNQPINGCGMKLSNWITSGHTKDLNMLTPQQRKNTNLLEPQTNNIDSKPETPLQQMVVDHNPSVKNLEFSQLTPEVMKELEPLLPILVEERGLQHLPLPLRHPNYIFKENPETGKSLMEHVILGIKETHKRNNKIRIHIRIPESIIRQTTPEQKESIVKSLRNHITIEDHPDIIVWTHKLEALHKIQLKLSTELNKITEPENPK
jgi:hypothetical protein